MRNRVGRSFHTPLGIVERGRMWPTCSIIPFVPSARPLKNIAAGKRLFPWSRHGQGPADNPLASRLVGGTRHQAAGFLVRPRRPFFLRRCDFADSSGIHFPPGVRYCPSSRCGSNPIARVVSVRVARLSNRPPAKRPLAGGFFHASPNSCKRPATDRAAMSKSVKQLPLIGLAAGFIAGFAVALLPTP